MVSPSIILQSWFGCMEDKK